MRDVSIVTVFCALSQGCAANGSDLRACIRSNVPHKAIGRIRGVSSRIAVQPRASDAQCDKAGPKLFGMPVRPVQVDRERLSTQEAVPASTQPQQNLNGPLDALRAYGNSLKHIAAGIAISAALFAGMSVSSTFCNPVAPDAVTNVQSHDLHTCLTCSVFHGTEAEPIAGLQGQP